MQHFAGFWTLVAGAIVWLAAPVLPPQDSRPPRGAEMTEQLAGVARTFSGEMGIFAIDLRSGETLAVNGDTRFPTASTIKTAVMLEAWQQVADETLTLRSDTVIPLRDADKVGGAGVLRGMRAGLALTVADLIHLMIVLSDNTATNMLVERLGSARINAGLDRYGLKNTRIFRPTFRDGRADVLPELEREFGLGMTTPREMATLMALIANGKAVNAKASEAMRATLRQQQDRAMIPRLLPTGGGIQIGNKTGADEEKHAGADGVKRQVRADAAIVTGPDCDYVLAIYTRQVADTRWTVENDALVTGGRVSRMIFDYFTKAR